MTDLELMRAALDEAAKAAALGEVPVGAVVAKDGEIIARAHNRRESGKNATWHAELLAIDAACRVLGGWRLWQCELFVTLEPCPMCAGAIINSRLKRVIFAAADPKAGCCGSVVDLFALRFNHRPIMENGLLSDESQALLQTFFAGLRQKGWPARPPGRGKTMHDNVLVIGGSRGIGAACVRAFAEKGCSVAFTWHSSEAAAQQTLTAAESFGGKAAAIRADAANPAAAARAVREAEKLFGGPADVLVYNAGIAHYGLFTDTSDEDWQRVRGVDLDGAVWACRAVLPGMIRRKYGRIILISSMWGQVGASCEALYSAAKAGLIGLCRALAKEEGPSGITVNCVAPGAVDTEMMAGFSPADKAALCEDIPAGRLGTAEEIARSVMFLAGEDSGYINGQVLGQNGGFVV